MDKNAKIYVAGHHGLVGFGYMEKSAGKGVYESGGTHT